MKAFIAVIKKEFLEQLRLGKLLVLAVVFILFGIMNPATAKLTPALLEMFSETTGGITIEIAEVTALDSWTQFFKNMPMALVIFIFLETGIFTKEYDSGTLVLSLTKGLERYKVVIAKTVTLLVLWTLGYMLSFAISYGYTVYFWDNSITKNLGLSVVCLWLFGVWVISLTVLFSVILSTGSAVSVALICVVAGLFFIGIVPDIKEYLPTQLLAGQALNYGLAEAKTYTKAVIIAGVSAVVFLVASVPIFNRKNL